MSGFAIPNVCDFSQRQLEVLEEAKSFFITRSGRRIFDRWVPFRFTEDSVHA